MIIEKTSRIKTMVIGLNVSFAILNQMKENAQHIIARKTPPYILILFFTGWQVNLFGRANLIKISGLEMRL
jgi:hypothetical protein